MNSEQLINEIRKLYPDNTGEYLFKSCCIVWIVVLKKVEDTITNQSRLPSDDPNRTFAKYRANKLFVVDIVNKFYPNGSTNEIYNSIHPGKKILYRKGKIVECDSFDKNLDKICAEGIHFFEKIDCAFHLESSAVNGSWISWNDDGKKFLECEYTNGKINGKWTRWYENGIKKTEGECLNGIPYGRWTYWNENGQKESEIEYPNGEFSRQVGWYQ